VSYTAAAADAAAGCFQGAWCRNDLGIWLLQVVLLLLLLKPAAQVGLVVDGLVVRIGVEHGGRG
jgi:hypothetical protein